MRLERVERPGERLDPAGERVLRPERVEQQDEQRAEVGDGQPAERARQQQPELEPRPRIQPRRHAPGEPGRDAARSGVGVTSVGSVIGDGHGAMAKGSPGVARGALRPSLATAGVSAAKRGPGLDPVVLVLAGRRRRRRRRSRPAAWSSTRSCRSRPRRSRASARSDRARASRRSRTPAWLVGASPNQTVAWPFASADAMWSIHLYMQLGCLASAWIIQVSDQPVGPFVGQDAGDRLALALQQVDLELPGRADARRRRRCTTPSGRCSCPSTAAPASRCFSSRSMAASNWASLSWYGLVMPRSGCVAIRCSAASAM